MVDSGVRISRDVVYGRATVQATTSPVGRELALDLYEPAEAGGDRLRPALVMAFGGAFHRGDKRSDEFEQDGQRNTPVAEWCAAFARRGGVACSIDYRLVQEDPDPGDTPVIGSPQRIPMSRVAHVRRLMGLPPADVRDVWAGMEAATDDMAMAFRFVCSQADRWRVDPARIAVGGFSAGARTALAAAYGKRIGAAAVLSLSGYIADDDLQRWVVPSAGLPPVMLVTGEHDLDYIAAQSAPMSRHFRGAGIACERWIASGAAHFYPCTTDAADDQGRPGILEDAVWDFLDRCLSLAR